MTRSKALVLLAGLAALGALVLVSASLGHLNLGPGRELPVVEREAKPESEKGIEGLMIPGGSGEEIFLRAVYIAVLVLLPVSIVALLISPEMRKRVLARLIPWLLLLTYLVLVRDRTQAPESAGAAVASGDSSGLAGGGRPTVAFDATPPKSVLWGTRMAVGVALALGTGGALWLVWRVTRRRDKGPLAQVAEQARNAIGELHAGGDVRNVILRCYFEMGRVLAEEKGVARESAMTPREFVRSLTAMGLPELAVRRLTRLFEDVRYGARVTGDQEEGEATASLTAIVDAARSAA
jgi:hypothetical protein